MGKAANREKVESTLSRACDRLEAPKFWVDLESLTVLPGLIDVHVHVYDGVAPLGIPATDDVDALLALEPDISAARICHVIGFDKGPVSRTLALLQTRGLVRIRPDRQDARTHSISLTPKGRATHDQVIVVALERERRLLACLRKDEREVLIDLLRRVHANLGAVTGQSEP